MSDIEDLIKHSFDQDYNKANQTFAEIMAVKMNDLLDQEKVRLANSIYNGGDEEETEEDLDLDDEDIDSDEEDLDDDDEDE